MHYWPGNKKQNIDLIKYWRGRDKEWKATRPSEMVSLCLWKRFVHVRVAGVKHYLLKVLTRSPTLQRSLKASEPLLLHILRFQSCSKTSKAVGGFLKMCILLIFAPSSSNFFQTCVWTVKHQLKQSTVWELQTPMWLQKRCLHLYQQRTECDDSLSPFILFSFWTYFGW